MGTVLAVPFGDGRRGIARLLHPPPVEFYDLVLGEGELVDLAALGAADVAFRVWVKTDALRDPAWEVLGHVSLTDLEEERGERFFKQDNMTGELTIYWELRGTSWNEIPASLEEVKGLERASVYEGWHVVDRLRDHFDGVPNAMVERQRRPVDPAEFDRLQQKRRLREQ